MLCVDGRRMCPWTGWSSEGYLAWVLSTSYCCQLREQFLEINGAAVIENANYDASMPQALVLMNSELFEAILKPHTQLRLNLAAAKYPDDQLAAIYQTLLARSPTEEEKSAWTKSGLDSIEDLVFALINTQQFIFVR